MGTYGQHLISLIEDENLDSIGLQSTALDHVVNTTRSTHNDVDTILKNLHVITDDGTADTGMALDIHEVTNGHNDFLNLLGKLTGGSKDQGLTLLNAQVDLLEDGDRESGGLSGTGLRLSNNIAICQDVSYP